LLEAERTDEALAAINQSIALIESADALCAKGMILTAYGKAAEACEAYEKALAKPFDPPYSTREMVGFNSVFVRTLKNTTPEENCNARKKWHERWSYKGEKKPHANDRVPDRKLRIGYVGGDFKMHSAAFIFGKVILHHDRNAYDPYCYMTMQVSAEDGQTKSFMEKTNWRDISAKNDDEAEAMIRADGIDILVDLSGHTGGNRLPLFTRKPAPVQAHGWGFAHGSGCPEIDYFFADPYSVPEEERKFFAEKIWDLSCIVAYEPPNYNHSGTSPAPVSRDGTFTFGVFGRFEKYSPQSIEAWHKILLRTPNSRLIVKDLGMRRPFAIKRFREVMHDVDPKRILFMQDCSHPEQFLVYQNADLVLDTFPHTGGVTALEILYMGVPVVTLYNGQVGGRTTATALRLMGRTGWVANSINGYVELAVRLAAERAELGKARTELRDQFLKSPLCGDYVKEVENAYRSMWWRYCGHETKQDELKEARQ
jgi:predicted O-linked N-acetylglucosamine transferase (SPINDLY family)